MKTKLLKVKTTGLIEQGNLRPKITDRLPPGVNMIVIEYGEGYAIVKLAWSEHPFIDKKPKNEDITNLLADTSVIEAVTDHPKAKELKVTQCIVEDLVEEKPNKKLKHKKKGLESSFIRKEKLRGEDVYVIDEG